MAYVVCICNDVYVAMYIWLQRGLASALFLSTGEHGVDYRTDCHHVYAGDQEQKLYVDHGQPAERERRG